MSDTAMKMRRLSASLSQDAPECDRDEVVMIPVELMDEFENHAYKPLPPTKMQALESSIRDEGILTPVLLREKEEGRYEIISGHQRVTAARNIGMTEVPAIIKDRTDEDAVGAMLDTNIQRDTLSLAEKIRIYGMKYETLKHQGRRGGSSLDELSEVTGVSRRTLQRLIALYQLLPELIDKIGDKDITQEQWLTIASLPKDEQLGVYEEIKEIIAYEKPERRKTEYVERRNRKLTIDRAVIEQYFPGDHTDAELIGWVVYALNEWYSSLQKEEN